jgi:hypothetical protein
LLTIESVDQAAAGHFGGGGRSFGGGARAFHGGGRAFHGGGRAFHGGGRAFHGGGRSFGGMHRMSRPVGRSAPRTFATRHTPAVRYASNPGIKHVNVVKNTGTHVNVGSAGLRHGPGNRLAGGPTGMGKLGSGAGGTGTVVINTGPGFIPRGPVITTGPAYVPASVPPRVYADQTPATPQSDPPPPPRRPRVGQSPPDPEIPPATVLSPGPRQLPTPMPCPTIKVVLASHTSSLNAINARLAKISTEVAITQQTRDERLRAAKSDQERAEITAGYMRDLKDYATEVLQLRQDRKPLEADIETLNQWSFTNCQ